jgi:hypothetical protein
LLKKEDESGELETETRPTLENDGDEIFRDE